MLEIRLLGELTVRRDGEPVALPQSKRTRALLTYLLLNPGPQRRERLCELLWQMPDDPRAALRWSLSKLRGVMNEAGTERIRADRERVALDAADVRVDLLEIRGALAPGAGAVDTDRLAGFAHALAAEALAGLELSDQPDYHYFLATVRRQARDMRTAVLRALADRCATDSADAVPWLQALVEAEPYDVDVHRRLVAALAMAGRRKDAERQRAVSLATLGGLGDVEAAALQRAVHARPRASEPTACPPAPEVAEQRIRFCRAADGVQIAYASVGEGPPLVKTANWLNHLEFDWESPVWRHVFRGLSSGRTLIRYDARGNGLSDWDTDDYSFESMVSDLEAVADAAGFDRFPLLGLSQGCAVSVEYAARHPERVSRLILIGGYALGWNRAGSAALARGVEAMLTLIHVGWGQANPAFRQMFTSLFMPDAPPENHEWFNELQRVTTSPDNAARLVRACGEVDVLDRLSQVRAPTLVLHARNESMATLNAGRKLAAGIPGARFVGLDSRNHLLPEDDPAWPRLLSEINAFLAE